MLIAPTPGNGRVLSLILDYYIDEMGMLMYHNVCYICTWSVFRTSVLWR